jgi:hypothetical protein
MGSFNKYNDRSLSQLLQESAAILAEDEFPPGSATTEPPPADTGELPPDEGAIDAGAPPGEEGAEDTPEGIANQIRDLVDKLLSKLGVGGEPGSEEGSENVGSTEGGSPQDIAAPATPPPMEGRKKPVTPKKPLAPVKAKR